MRASQTWKALVITVLFWDGDFEPHDGLQEHRARRPQRTIEGVRGRHAKGHFVGIRLVNFATKHGDFDLHQRAAE